MKTLLLKVALCVLATTFSLSSCQTTKSELTLEQQGDSLTVIHITNPTKYLLLPVEENAAESQVRLDTGDAADTDMDVRLARKQVDYFVPFELPAGAKMFFTPPRQEQTPPLCASTGLPRMPFAGNR